MRPGSPGFIGERLREAREARGITGVALAEILGVSRQAVSQYELGAVTPAPDLVRVIAGALNIPESFFWRPIRRSAIGTTFYRSLARTTKLVRSRAERRLGWLKEIVYYLDEIVEFPAPEFPDANCDPLRLNDDDIENIAGQVRREFGIPGAPVPNLIVLLENRGAIVSRPTMGTETVDAFSEWSHDEGRPYLVLNSDKDSAVRSRYDAAHELGHQVLHRHVPMIQMLASKDFYKLLEGQAHRFAGAFLLPEKEFSDDLFFPTLSEFQRLKAKWGVAMAAMLKRCQHLELLPEDEVTRLWIAIGRNGWRKREPLDDEIEPEQPRLLRDSFEIIINEGARTRAEIRSSLCFAERDIEDLSGLPEGFLADPQPGVVVALKNTEARSLGSGNSTGNVIPFRGKGQG